MIDAIVVGGGPGGSTAAWQLARAGRRVVLLDAARFPRVKLCAGWVTRAVWRALEIDPERYPRTIQPFAEASLELGATRLQTRWPRVVSFGIIRREFDDFLLHRAREAGAEVHENTRVQSIERTSDGVAVRTAANEVFHAPVVIGAGGHHCPVSRAFGNVSRDEAVVVTRESETRIGAERLRHLTPRHGTPELFAEPDFRGYGWYFTKGDFLNLGIGCLSDGRDLHRRCEALLAKLRLDGRLAADLELEPFRGHAYAVHVQEPRQVAGERFLLVGDAAALARGISGEGIGPAVESGRLAARAVLEDGPDAGPSYARRLVSRFGDGRPHALGRLAAALPSALTRALARTVCDNPLLRRKVIFEGAFGMG